jgi:NAD(P)-dependent dehydrogenase (short-subunit alcohol dehydrogenase family)
VSQRVVVSGGANGLGLCIANMFLEHGARVHVGDIDANALVAAQQSKAMSGTVCDISDPADVDRFIAEAVEQLGGIDVLVNNTGLSGPTMPVELLTLEDWRKVMSVNLDGTFLVTQACIPHLRNSGSGSIVIMSSVSGRMGHPNRSPYATSKWGLVGLTKTLAQELGRYNIRANAILPGAVDNARTRKVLKEVLGIAGEMDEAALSTALAAKQSIARLIPMEEIAELAVFLSSSKASTISGQTFPIDGDMRAG